MDTSETYIKMCEKAVEIQAPKQAYNKGDYFTEISMGTYPIVLECHPHGVVKSCTIWLPLQGQLQEMLMPYRYKENYDMCSAFAAFLCGTPDIMSMEQLWLAFVMKEKYNKVWKSDEWVAI